MAFTDNPAWNHHSPQKAYTLIELLAVMLVVAFATVAYVVVREKHGQWVAAAAAVLAMLLGILLVIVLYRWRWACDERCLRELRQNLRSIYRVKSLPTSPGSIVKPAGAEILVGDYGWEARPNRRDGLIHLQGLTADWRVVWHAGFQPDQLEVVGPKPSSQYDYWAPYWAKAAPPPPCPFPVQDRKTPTMGLPHHSGRYFENYPAQPT